MWWLHPNNKGPVVDVEDLLIHHDELFPPTTALHCLVRVLFSQSLGPLYPTTLSVSINKASVYGLDELITGHCNPERVLKMGNG